MFEELLRAWDGEEAVIRFDRTSGAWMFVCIHSTVLGPAGGGTRLRVYGAPGEGLADAMRLSARGYHRVLRVARTLADLDGAEKVGRIHLAEALSYRALADEIRRAA